MIFEFGKIYEIKLTDNTIITGMFLNDFSYDLDMYYNFITNYDGLNTKYKHKIADIRTISGFDIIETRAK